MPYPAPAIARITNSFAISPICCLKVNFLRFFFFDALAFQSATDNVAELYRNEGYLYSTVTPFLQTFPAEADEPPGVSIGWRIEEGQPAYINRVEIAGNDFTYDQVVRERIFLAPFSGEKPANAPVHKKSWPVLPKITLNAVV